MGMLVSEEGRIVITMTNAQVATREPHVDSDDLLWLLQAMMGDPVQGRSEDGPALTDEAIEKCVCGFVTGTRGICVDVEDGWVTVEGDVEAWTDVERLTLSVPGFKGLCRRPHAGPIQQ